ncbi:MAG: GNAT family N-acetyltransferase [Acidimicrobiia bacterium]
MSPTEALARLPAIDEVLQAAYGVAGFGPSLARRITVQPDGFVAAEEAGDDGTARVVGVGTAVAYPDAGYGWLGLIGTHPDRERRGIGAAVTARLVELLERKGCAAVLDASVAGRPVYERLGFVEAGVTTVLVAGTPPARRAAPDQTPDQTPDPTPDPTADGVAPPLVAADLAEVIAFDRRCTGADRSRLYGALCVEHEARSFVARRGRELVGVAFATERSIAPLLAVDEAALRSLLGAALRLRYASAPTVVLPASSGHRAALEAFGFTEQRTLTHMRRGIGRLPGERGLIAGQASLGEG